FAGSVVLRQSTCHAAPLCATENDQFNPLETSSACRTAPQGDYCEGNTAFYLRTRPKELGHSKFAPTAHYIPSPLKGLRKCRNRCRDRISARRFRGGEPPILEFLLRQSMGRDLRPPACVRTVSYNGSFVLYHPLTFVRGQMYTRVRHCRTGIDPEVF